MTYVPPTPEQQAASTLAYAVDHLAQAQRTIANLITGVASKPDVIIFSVDPEQNGKRIDLCSQAVVELQNMRERLSP